MRLTDWACAETPAGLVDDPAKLDSLDLDWVPFAAPGTVAGALAAAGRWSVNADRDFDGSDWWCRCAFRRPDDDPDRDRWTLDFEGLATVAAVWLNGHPLLSSSNMFRIHRVDVSDQLQDDNELVVRFSALTETLAVKRSRPRWKTNLVEHQNLRWVRTALHGRRRTWTGSFAPVGPWRPVTLRRREPVRVAWARIDARPAASGGHVEATIALDVDGDGLTGDVTLVVGRSRGVLASVTEPAADAGPIVFTGRVEVPEAEPWWPATHGDQPRYDASIGVAIGDDIVTVPLGRVGFRTAEFGPAEAPVLRVNGQDIFARGVVWSPVDPVGLTPTVDELRATLEAFRAAGMNLIRVPGTAVYESDEFLDLCDELGLLVWHDLMFARMDYPTGDDEFRADIRAEVADAAGRFGGHPCVAVVGGGSEIGQQAAMVGRPVPSDDLVGAFVADIVADRLPGVPYLVDVPIGGTHPFTVDAGVAHYFGVGGYRRPVTDARRCGVRFASESLAFSNVPVQQSIDELRAAGVDIGDSGWKRGIPRDPGASWDFEDVRDHYVRERYGVDPAAVRATDPDRYLDLGRATGAAVMAEVFAAWRRAGSGCGGALVLESRDCRPGAGSGLIDAAGRPKVALAALARVLAPVALLPIDEGLNGLDVWAVNDRPDERTGLLEVGVFQDEACIARVERDLAVAGRSQQRIRVEEWLGAFLDVTYAYRFGPNPVTCVAVRWHAQGTDLARAVYAPGPQPTGREQLGLQAIARPSGDGRFEIEVTTGRYAHFVQIEVRGGLTSATGFDLEPGGSILVEATSPGPLRARLSALNGAGSEPIRMEYASDSPGAS